MKKNSLEDAMAVIAKENPKLDAFSLAQVAYGRKCIELAEVRKQLTALKLKIN